MKRLDRVRKTIESVDLNIKALYEERPKEYILVTRCIGVHSKKLYDLGLTMMHVHDSKTEKGFIGVHLSENEDAKPMHGFKSKLGRYPMCRSCKRHIRVRIVADEYLTYNIEDNSKHVCLKKYNKGEIKR
jgi:hypothetical protein